GVAQGRKAARDGGQDEGEDDSRPRAWARGVADNGRAGRREDAGADRRADAEGGEMPLAERAFETTVLDDIGLEIRDRLPRDKLAHCSIRRAGPRRSRFACRRTTGRRRRPTR